MRERVTESTYVEPHIVTRYIVTCDECPFEVDFSTEEFAQQVASTHKKVHLNGVFDQIFTGTNPAW